MATQWQRMGHEVLVVAADWTHLRRVQPVAHYGVEVIEGVPFRILPVPRHRGNGPLRFANILAFAAVLRASRRSLVRWRPDLVVASSTHPFDVRPAAHIADRASAVFIHEVHDLWPLTPRLLGGLSEGHPMIRLMQREEDFACQRADAVVSILPATKEYLSSHGMDPARWIHISNGVPAGIVAGGHPAPSESDTLRVGYFGGHGPSNDLETLIDAARILRTHQVEFHLVGSGSEKASLRAKAADLPRVHFHDEVTPAEAQERMRTMDVLWWGVRESPLYDFGLGLNKVFDYMASGLPIVGSTNYPGPASGVGCQLTVAAGESAATARGLMAIAKMPRLERRQMGLRGREHVARFATHQFLAESFLSQVGRVVDSMGEQSPSDRVPPCRV